MTDASGAPHSHLKTGRARASVVGVFWSVVNTGLGTVLTALVFYIASRFLTPYDFGVVALAVSVVSIASAIAPAAFGEALVQRAEIGRTHLDTVFWMCMAAGVLLYLPILALAPFIADWLGEPVLAALLPFIGLRLFFEMLAAVPNAVIIRQMKFKLIAIRTAIANGVAAVVCVTLLWLGYGFWALALSQIANVATAALVVLISAGWRPGLSPRLQAFRDLAPYGVFATGSRMMNVLRLDQLLIGALGGAALAGLFNFANRLFQMLTGLISGALAAVSHSLFSSLQSEAQKGREAFLLAAYASALVAFPIFAGLIVVADPAVPMIFGEQWQPAVVAVRALSVVGLLSSIGVVQAALITAHGKANWWFYYQLSQQVLSVLTILVLMPYGFDIALIGLAAKAVLLWPIAAMMTLRLIGLSAFDYARVFAAPALATLAMVLAVVEAPRVMAEASAGMTLLVQIAGGAVFYAALAGALSLRRLRMVWAVIKSKRKVQTA